jgi:predicted Zn-dependent protease
MRWLALALLLCSCQHISKAPGDWLLGPYAPYDVPPHGRFEHRDLTWQIVGIEKVRPEDRGKFVAEVKAALDLWASVDALGFTFDEVAQGGDIRIYVDDRPHWRPGVQALAWTPDSICRGAILIRWDAVGQANFRFRSVVRGNPQVVPNRWGFTPMQGPRRLATTVAHEVGHTLGIRHLHHPAALMHAQGSFGRLEFDITDLREAAKIYHR